MITRCITLFLVVWFVAGGVSAQDESGRTEEAVRLNREGIKHLETGRYRAAITAFQNAGRLLPDNRNIRKNPATAFSHLGVAQLKSGRFTDAARALNQAAGLEPENLRILYYRGFLAFKRGNYRESIRLLEGVVKKKPDHDAAWKSLGHSYYRLDRLEATIAAWKKVLALKPEGNAALRQYLKRARSENGFKEIAVAGRSRHFRVRADSSRSGFEAVAAEVLRFLEGGYDRVCADLGFYPREVVTVVLYTKKEFQLVTGTHHWVAGTFDGARIRLAVRDFHTHREAIRKTLVHEFTHMVVHRLAGGMSVPAWINEGIARVEEGTTAREADERIRRLGGKRALFPFDKLVRPFTYLKSAADAQRAYAQSCSFTHHLIASRTTRGVGRFIRLLRDPPEGGIPSAFKQVFGIEMEEAVTQWKAALP